MNLFQRTLARFRCWLAERRRSPAAEPQAVGNSILSPPLFPLIEDNPQEPLWPRFQRYGPGTPGVIRETASDWVIRTALGCVAGGATIQVGELPEPLISIDVAIDPGYRRRGYASRLYEALEAAGIDVELGSDTSLKYGTMTGHGYAFMVGRRAKKAASMTGPRSD